MTTKTLGTLAMIASPAFLLAALRSGYEPTTTSRVSAALGLLFVAGWACSAAGLRALRATGAGRAGAALFAAQAAGLLLAASQQVQDILFQPPPTDSRFYQICDAAWPLSVLFMLVVGGFAVAARRLAGWRRWAPMLCGLALPLLVGTMSVAGQQAGTAFFGAYTAVAWCALGYAVRTS